jgi:hypothetical protein
LGRAAAQQRGDARERQARIERFRQVVVGARFEREDDVVLARARAEHDDRQGACGGLGAQAAHQHDARLHRQIPFEQQQVGPLARTGGQRGVGVGHALERMPCPAEVQAQQLLGGAIGIDRQDGRGHRHTFGQGLGKRRLDYA